MSSNPKTDDSLKKAKPKTKKMRAAKIGIDTQKRMSSITRRLHWYGIRKKLLLFFNLDLLFFILACVGWCADQEFTKLGRLAADRHRSFTVISESGKLLYRVASSNGKLLFQVSALTPLIVISITTGSLFALQLLGQIFVYFREDKKIRAILSPINQIALKADELSRLSFTEDKFRSDEGSGDKYHTAEGSGDKYHAIEEALEKIQPGQVSAETPLSFTDSDLAGVEAAMNNLLMRMRDTYRQQARFVNDASHELRTPIAVILGYANMLDRWGKSDPKTLEEGIAAIKNESEHMNHLVEQLLFLARGDSGKTTLDLQSVNICDLIQEVYEESFMIDEAHRYRIRLPEDAVTITADPGLLKQAVRILTDNAAKYTPEGEEIILSAGRDQNNTPYLQVQDVGVGIAESEIPKIFDRFYRSDEVRSSAGTGLGLAIAKWIVDKHKGHFEILSRQNLGTRIRILLPENM